MRSSEILSALIESGQVGITPLLCLNDMDRSTLAAKLDAILPAIAAVAQCIAEDSVFNEGVFPTSSKVSQSLRRLTEELAVALDWPLPRAVMLASFLGMLAWGHKIISCIHEEVEEKRRHWEKGIEKLWDK